MAGRPPLRIGQHGKIKRIEVEPGVWIARCRYRDTDGVTRIVERRSPQRDQHGKLAEDELLSSLANRQALSEGNITLETKIVDLVSQHIDRLEEDGRADRTIDSYRYANQNLTKIIPGVRVREATPARIDAAIRSVRRAHGDGAAHIAKVVMKGGLQLAVMASVINTNPVRDVSPLTQKRAKGAPALDGDELRAIFAKVQESETCQKGDLVDPIIMFIATGLRISELFGLRWSDFDEAASTITVSGKVVRANGKGVRRIDQTKTAAGRRVLPLPKFAVETLKARLRRDFYGSQPMVFPSTLGTWRDPGNFNRSWRKVRDDLGVPDVTSHSFRKSLGTLIDDEGLSARVGADHLGHAKVSMTQDVYMKRGRSHTAVATLLDRVISDEKTMDKDQLDMLGKHADQRG